MDKIIVAFESEKTSARIRELIEGSGVAGCIVCHSAAEVKRLIQKQHFTTVVSGYKLRDETAEFLLEDLPISCSVLVIAVQDLLDMIDNPDIFKLSAPVSRNDLIASVRMLLQVGRRMERYTRPQRSEEEMILVERAKGALMDRYGMTEEQAHRFLQKKSMDAGAKLVQTAQTILDET